MCDLGKDFILKDCHYYTKLNIRQIAIDNVRKIINNYNFIFDCYERFN